MSIPRSSDGCGAIGELRLCPTYPDNSRFVRMCLLVKGEGVVQYGYCLHKQFEAELDCLI